MPWQPRYEDSRHWAFGQTPSSSPQSPFVRYEQPNDDRFVKKQERAFELPPAQNGRQHKLQRSKTGPISEMNKSMLIEEWVDMKVQQDGKQPSEVEISELQAKLNQLEVDNTRKFAMDDPYWAKIFSVICKRKVLDTAAFGEIDVFVMTRDDQNRDHMSLYSQNSFFSEHNIQKEKQKAKNESASILSALNSFFE